MLNFLINTSQKPFIIVTIDQEDVAICFQEKNEPGINWDSNSGLFDHKVVL